MGVSLLSKSTDTAVSNASARSIARSTVPRAVSDNSAIGDLQKGEALPSLVNAHFVGAGLLSTNKAACNGRSFK